MVAAITNIGDTIRNVFTDGNLGGARQFLINLFGEEATGVIDGAITILQTVWNILSGFIEFVNTYVRPIVEQIFSFIVGTVLPQIAQAFAEWAPTIALSCKDLRKWFHHCNGNHGSYSIPYADDTKHHRRCT